MQLNFSFIQWVEEKDLLTQLLKQQIQVILFYIIGYMSRRLMKNIEDNCIKYDYSVRTSNGNIT